MVRLFSIAALLLISINVFSQITVDNSVSPEDAVQELLGGDFEITNLVFNGEEVQIGTFECVGCGLDFDSGIILSTGDIETALGPNNNGGLTIPDIGFGNEINDPDLTAINNVTYSDACVVEFDFVAQGDSMSFEYSFGSDEYIEFVDAGFNDTFGFFISGPGISGTFSNDAENIALIPGTTTPVSIDNVNNVNNSSFYIDNGDGNSEPQSSDPNVIGYDGYTVGLLAEKNGLICGETYHLKIIIADSGSADFADSILDSGVFLRSESLVSNSFLTIDFNVNVGGFTDGLVEGCGTGELIFTRPDDFMEDEVLAVELEYLGSATYGEDYTALPILIEFAPGETEVIYNIEAFLDNNDLEGEEIIEVIVRSEGFCQSGGEPITYNITIAAPDPLQFPLDPSIILCANDTVLMPEVTGGVGDYSLEWANESNSVISNENSLLVQMELGESFVYTFTAVDFCNNTYSLSTEISRPEPLVLTLPQGLTGDCLTDFEVAVEANIETPVSYVWSGSPSIVPIDDRTINYKNIQSATIEVYGDAGCNNTASAQTFINVTQIPIDLVTSEDTTICFGRNLVLSAQASGGSGELSYIWSGNGQVYNSSQISVGPTSSTFYELVVTDECPYSVGGNVQVEVERVNASFITSNLGNDTFRFQANTDPDCADCTYLWEFTDGDISEEEFPIHEFTESGYIGATLTVTTPGTCEAKYTSLIDIPPIVYIPNAFTPDNDGINDVWKIEIRGIDKYEISIYNRWGQVVFHSIDPTEAWNGNSIGGDHYVPNGIYSYNLEYRGLNSQAIVKLDTVSIFR